MTLKKFDESMTISFKKKLHLDFYRGPETIGGVPGTNIFKEVKEFLDQYGSEIIYYRERNNGILFHLTLWFESNEDYVEFLLNFGEKILEGHYGKHF